MRHVFVIGWIAIRELFYERVFYLLISFGLLSISLSLLLGQMTYTEESKLTLDFLLAAIQISMTLFSVFMGISLFHRELVQGSISMVLSKPISRASFLIGKFLGQIGVQLLVIATMAVITFIATLRFNEGVSYLSLTQSVFLIFLEVTVITSITYLFAVNAGAITAAVATLFLVGLGHLSDTVTKTFVRPEEKITWGLLKPALPNLEIFNMKTLVSYGISISGSEIGWALAYAAICTTMFLAMAAFCFDRKDIFT